MAVPLGNVSLKVCGGQGIWFEASSNQPAAFRDERALIGSIVYFSARLERLTSLSMGTLCPGILTSRKSYFETQIFESHMV